MRIDILTIFPTMFTNIFEESIIKRAKEKGIVEIHIHDFREFSNDPHKKVDFPPFGGGAGMLLRPEPIFACVESLKNEESCVILLTPDGEVYNQKLAYSLSKKKHLILICGHYEGFDERIRTLADMEISIGDYILTGGEYASMILADSIIRLLPGVIKEESHQNDSFNNHLLDYPSYTKPRIFRGMEVPEVLLSGNHKEIEKYRLEESIKRTKERRPDLLER